MPGAVCCSVMPPIVSSAYYLDHEICGKLAECDPGSLYQAIIDHGQDLTGYAAQLRHLPVEEQATMVVEAVEHAIHRAYQQTAGVELPLDNVSCPPAGHRRRVW